MGVVINFEKIGGPDKPAEGEDLFAAPANVPCKKYKTFSVLTYSYHDYPSLYHGSTAYYD